jgi:Cu+-exporting ATPase
MIIKSIGKGVAGTGGLLGLYFLIVGAVSGWAFARSQFLQNWNWIGGLAVGFGIQIFLFAYLRALHRERMSGAVVAATGMVSGLTMVACCAHYLVNILPIIGISALAAVVGQYQQELFVFGAVSNIAGIVYMARQLFKVSRKNNEQ